MTVGKAAAYRSLARDNHTLKSGMHCDVIIFTLMQATAFVEKIYNYRFRALQAIDFTAWHKKCLKISLSKATHILLENLMIMNFKKLAATVFITLGCNVASAAIINFDTATITRYLTLSESGFNITGGNQGSFGISSTQYCGPSCADNGTRYLTSINTFGGGEFSETIIIKAANSGAFSLGGFSGAEYPFNSTVSDYFAAGIQVTGVKLDNSLISQNFMLDQINDGTAGVQDFQAFTSSAFGEVKEIRFTGIQGRGHDFAIDNIILNDAVVANIPEPSSMALLTIGFLGIGALYRKQRSAG